MPFRTGPEIQPFSAGAREGIRLLESVSPVEIASSVPRIIITKVDPRTGRPIRDVRPLMYDLMETPQFGADGEGFGIGQERFFERATVSLRGLQVKSELQYGVDVLRKITLQFTVHRPDIVFDRGSDVPWREILEEGRSFSLEYGWVADPTVCRNSLFNGLGHVTDRGTVIRSTQIVLLVVARWTVRLKETGEIDVTIEAYENGDIALRETRFSDVIGAVIGRTGTDGISDVDAARSLYRQIDSIVPTVLQGRGKYFRLIDVLDSVAAPMIEEAVRAFGYRGNPPVRLAVANFNSRAGKQSMAWGGQSMSGGASIGNFLIPKMRLMDEISGHLSRGRAVLLRNFLNMLFGIVNSDEAWARSEGEITRPHVGVSYDTTVSNEGLTLNMMILDRNAVSDPVRRLGRLPLENQTRENIMAALEDAGVPVLEFSRAGNLVVDAGFEMQPNSLLQSIQVETAEGIRKSRVETSAMPDSESRKGYAFPHDIIPISILEGDITMQGNFVLAPYDRLWVEFFGASSISGIFNVIGKEDKIEPGKFTSTFHLISEGIDPLNTRFRFTPEELASRRSGPRR